MDGLVRTIADDVAMDLDINGLLAADREVARDYISDVLRQHLESAQARRHDCEQWALEGIGCARCNPSAVACRGLWENDPVRKRAEQAERALEQARQEREHIKAALTDESLPDGVKVNAAMTFLGGLDTVTEADTEWALEALRRLREESSQ